MPRLHVVRVSQKGKQILQRGEDEVVKCGHGHLQSRIIREKAYMFLKKTNCGSCAISSGEWRPFSAIVASGASEHVVPPDVADHIRLDAGSKKGCEYEVADGGAIENLSERRCLVAKDHPAIVNRIDLQVTDVHDVLFSVAKMVGAGQRVIFVPKGSYIKETVARERIPIERRCGIRTHMMVLLGRDRP